MRMKCTKDSQIFSISNDIVVSDSTFTRLNSILKSLNIKVEEVYYREISKFVDYSVVQLYQLIDQTKNSLFVIN